MRLVVGRLAGVVKGLIAAAIVGDDGTFVEDCLARPLLRDRQLARGAHWPGRTSQPGQRRDDLGNHVLLDSHEQFSKQLNRPLVFILNRAANLVRGPVRPLLGASGHLALTSRSRWFMIPNVGFHDGSLRRWCDSYYHTIWHVTSIARHHADR